MLSMSGSKHETTELTREQRLLFAAEDVLARWAIIRASDGKLGGCGLADALKALDIACAAYEELDHA